MLKIDFPVMEFLQKMQAKVAIVNISKRTASQKFDNSEDVKNYPILVNVGIIKTIDGQNQGEMLAVKLKSSDGLQLGQQLDFSDPKVQIVNSHGRVWGKYNNRLAIKGDKINFG